VAAIATVRITKRFIGESLASYKRVY
jgi:hypothetical protein